MPGTGLVTTYNPEKVLILVNGAPLTGLGEDTAVEITPTSDLSTSKVGIDGDVTRSVGTDRRVDIVIRLMQSSPSNDVLSALIGVDVLTGGRLVAITVQDLLARDVFVCPQSWLTKKPTITYAREAAEREWAFQGLPSVWYIGGSNSIGF